MCQKKLGSGGFGEVWSCIDILAPEADKETDENTFAMKIENLVDPTDKEKLQGITKKQPVPQS